MIFPLIGSVTLAVTLAMPASVASKIKVEPEASLKREL